MVGRDPQLDPTPGRMMDLEAQQHLKDCLFHGVHKHICNSVWYFYSTYGTSYSQLMVAARKAEQERKPKKW